MLWPNCRLLPASGHWKAPPALAPDGKPLGTLAGAFGGFFGLVRASQLALASLQPTEALSNTASSCLLGDDKRRLLVLVLLLLGVVR